MSVGLKRKAVHITPVPGEIWSGHITFIRQECTEKEPCTPLCLHLFLFVWKLKHSNNVGETGVVEAMMIFDRTALLFFLYF